MALKTLVKTMAFVAYPAKDVQRTAAFYRDVVGLTQGETFGDRWVEFDVGGTTFTVTSGDSIGVEAGSQFSVAFEVDDINSMRDLLHAKNVEVSDVFESPSCFGAFVTDPDGNKFGLHELKARS